MTVAVAHHVSAISETVLAEAIKEAGFRQSDLVLINVTDTLDLDKDEALQVGIGDVVEKLAPGGTVNWRVEVVAAGNDVAEALLDAADALGAELLVLGARQRSPMAKAFLGSVTQSVILNARMPVLVVKR